MTVGQLVARNARRLRHELGLSLGELARRSRLAKQTIASVEAASGNPTVETLDRLADGLGVSVRALLTEFGSELSMTSERDARAGAPCGTATSSTADFGWGWNRTR